MTVTDWQGHELRVGDIATAPGRKFVHYVRIEAFRPQPDTRHIKVAARSVEHLVDLIEQRIVYDPKELTWHSSDYASMHPAYLTEFFRDRKITNA